MSVRTATSAVLLSFMASLLLAGDLPPDVEKKHVQMLYPVVRVTAKNAGGSGTILYSEDRGDGCQTYVLTNHHVVEGAINVVTEWSSLLQQDVKREANDEVKVEIFRYTAGSRQDFTDACQAEIVAHSKEHDLALLKLKTSRKLDHVAKLLPPDAKVYIFQPIYAVGCSLRHPPVATKGEINYLDDVIDKKVYWMGTANIVFGNSGGAVFTEHNSDYYFIGVPSRVAGSWSQIFPHMGWFIPITRVREWLKEEHLLFITDSKIKPSECFEKREQLRREAEARLVIGRKSEPTPAPPR